MFADLISIIYPQTCLNCNETLISAENFICTKCKLDLPVTDDHENPENSLFQKFAFERRIKSASSYLYFNQGGIAQKLLHDLKYNGVSAIGNSMGEWYGEELAKAMMPDLIIPVPLHKSKYRKRGYNQSHHIALGLASAFPESEIRSDIILRKKRTTTQTSKGKLERWQNMDNVYSDVREDITDKTILVVDDVITTGATVGMFCDKLIEAGARSIHIACMARR